MISFPLLSVKEKKNNSFVCVDAIGIELVLFRNGWHNAEKTQVREKYPNDFFFVYVCLLLDQLNEAFSLSFADRSSVLQQEMK